MPFLKSLLIIGSALAISACATSHTENDPANDRGIMWVKHAAEYKAVSALVYRSATQDLPGFIKDKTWDAMRGYGKPSALPPAVILDVDETVVSNVNFQLEFDRPFTNEKMDTWNSNNPSLPVPGARSFIEIARSLGVTVFFVTNRPCELKPGVKDPCPQEQTTIDDIQDTGVAVDADHLMLSNEQPAWDREKLVRREVIAKTHRIIMLIGDDFSDFAPCVRANPHGSCTATATRASRADALQQNRDFWGNGWYILPNPMHGSWTSVE